MCGIHQIFSQDLQQKSSRYFDGQVEYYHVGIVIYYPYQDII